MWRKCRDLIGQIFKNRDKQTQFFEKIRIYRDIQVSSRRRASKVSALHVARLGLNDGAQLWISFKLFSKQTFFHNAY